MQTKDDSTTWADDVHTAENPYCDDLDCWCHTNTEYHDFIHEPAYGEGELEAAYAFYGISR